MSRTIPSDNVPQIALNEHDLSVCRRTTKIWRGVVNYTATVLLRDGANFCLSMKLLSGPQSEASYFIAAP